MTNNISSNIVTSTVYGGKAKQYTYKGYTIWYYSMDGYGIDPNYIQIRRWINFGASEKWKGLV